MSTEHNNCSRIPPLFHKTHDKLEDLFFTLVSKLPESLIAKSVMDWLGRYTNKRIAELQRQIIHDRWQTVKLDETLKQIKDEKGEK